MLVFHRSGAAVAEVSAVGPRPLFEVLLSRPRNISKAPPVPGWRWGGITFSGNPKVAACLAAGFVGEADVLLAHNAGRTSAKCCE